MDRRTRLFEFPGGVLEMTDYGDEDNGERPGFYPELLTSTSSALPQRVPAATDIDPPSIPITPANEEVYGQVLQLLRDLP